MIRFLAAAAKERREDAEPKRKIIHIAVVADMDPSTVWRFEQGHWPRDVDTLIAAYATELGVESLEIWSRALELWRASAADREGDLLDQAVADVALEGGAQPPQEPSERDLGETSEEERREAG